jgi:hypothetical protein
VDNRITAEKFLMAKGLVREESPINLMALSTALLYLTDPDYKLAPLARSAVRAVAILLNEMGRDEIVKEISERVAEEIGARISQELTKNVQAATEAIAKATEGLPTAEDIKTLSVTIASKPTYAQKAAATPTSLAGHRAVEREAIRARQILIDHEKESDLSSASNEGIKEKANESLTIMTADTHMKFKVVACSRIRNGGLLMEFDSAEAVTWIMEGNRKREFARLLGDTAEVKTRTFSVMCGFVPLTANPSNQEELREIEEVNGMQNGTIARARWAKPPERRSKGQRFGHMFLTLNDVKTANSLITRGITIRQKRVQVSKPKKEPLRCVKCQRFGHMAKDCTETDNTCGTCGGKHDTKECNEEGIAQYCTECKTDGHPSWSRECPAFRRRCESFDSRCPENQMPYYLTDDPITHMTSPQVVPAPAAPAPAAHQLEELPDAAFARIGPDHPPLPGTSQPRRGGLQPASSQRQTQTEIPAYFAHNRHEYRNGSSQPRRRERQNVASWDREPETTNGAPRNGTRGPGLYPPPHHHPDRYRNRQHNPFPNYDADGYHDYE